MKKIILMLAVASFAVACNNEAATDDSINTDSVSTMDQNRPTDTRTFNPSDTMGGTQVDTNNLRNTTDTLGRGRMQDSTNRR